MPSFFSYFKGFNKAEAKANCKMASTRVKQLMNKTTCNRSNLERECANLIGTSKLEKARIKAEQCIQHANLEMGLDVLETHLELCATRIEVISNSRHLPQDLYVCISSIAYAADRVDNNQEISVVFQQLCKKFGQEFMLQMKNNDFKKVHPAIVNGFSITPPSQFELEQEMSRIAHSFNISYLPAISSANNYSEPVQLSVKMPPASGNTTPASSSQRVSREVTESMEQQMNQMNNNNVVNKNSSNIHPAAPKIGGSYSEQPQSSFNTAADPAAEESNGEFNSEEGPGFDNLMARFQKLKQG